MSRSARLVLALVVVFVLVAIVVAVVVNRPSTVAKQTSPTGTRQTPASTSAPASPSTSTSTSTAPVPRPDHVVLVILENKKYSSIVGNSSAPYFNSLTSQGAVFTRAFAIGHPSQPNYIALFSGSTQGVTSDSCPKDFVGHGNLGAQLIAAGFTFTGYSESMPADGYSGCTSGDYARKHNPWVDFDNVPASSNLTYTHFPTDYSQLPSVSIVVPNLCNDMHDCSISTGDRWLRANMDAYVRWAKTHNSLLIVTFDEDDGSRVNQIYTLFVGQHVKAGEFDEQINHYTVLRTLETAFGLAPLNNAAKTTPITDVWR